MDVWLVPLLGPFHLRSPAYNAVTVRDLVRAIGPEAIATTALGDDAFASPRWQDTPEIALPLAVVPWARHRGLPVVGVFEPSPDPAAGDDFRRYLQQYQRGQEILREVDAALEPARELLAEPLTLARIERELLPRLGEHQELREARFGEGPGSDWLRSRAAAMAGRIAALGASRVAVLAGLDHLGMLREALAPLARLQPLPDLEVSGEARERSLLDFAFRGDAAEPGNLLASLRTIEGAEARYHEANLLLANAHAAEALELLEEASRGDFSRPYFLPGYLLCRLGQLRDLAGERRQALRAYRAVRALGYAPPEALEAAAAGLERAFRLPDGETPQAAAE